MRKKCDSCGFICFISDETCKQCGSHRLSIDRSSNDVPIQENFSLKAKILKFIKYFILMILVQFALLGVGTLLGIPVFKILYEPVFTLAAKFVFIGHADVIFPLLLLILTFSFYAVFWSYLLVLSPFRKHIFLPMRKDVYHAFTKLRARLNGN